MNISRKKGLLSEEDGLISINNKPSGYSSVKIRNIVLLSLFTALTCIFTMFIRIPTFTGGYINPGDIIVIFAGFLLGPSRGFIAGALGSSMADFLGGYFIFVPVTFIAKGGEAFIAGYIGKDLNREGKSVFLITGAALSVLWMVTIYFLGETLLMGTGKAVTAVLPNLFQAFFGLTGSIILYNMTGKFFREKSL